MKVRPTRQILVVPVMIMKYHSLMGLLPDFSATLSGLFPSSISLILNFH